MVVTLAECICSLTDSAHADGIPRAELPRVYEAIRLMVVEVASVDVDASRDWQTTTVCALAAMTALCRLRDGAIAELAVRGG